MPTPRHNANGARRQAVVARVRAEEHTCAVCDAPVDPTLTYLPGQHGKVCPRKNCTGCIPDPMRGEVDEDIPRSRGGSPYDRANTHLVHRVHNQWKGSMTLAEARAKFFGTDDGSQPPSVRASRIW